MVKTIVAIVKLAIVTAINNMNIVNFDIGIEIFVIRSFQCPSGGENGPRSSNKNNFSVY